MATKKSKKEEELDLMTTQGAFPEKGVPSFMTGVSATTPVSAPIVPTTTTPQASNPAPAFKATLPSLRDEVARPAMPPDNFDVVAPKQSAGVPVEQLSLNAESPKESMAEAVRQSSLANPISLARPAAPASPVTTIQTPYGTIEATPQQAARFQKSPEMVQVEIDAIKNAPYRTPKGEFDVPAPITRGEIDERAARIAELEGKRDRIAEENRASKYLDNIEKLRGNRKGVMDADRKNFPDTKEGQKAFEEKWNSPQYRSIIDQPSLVTPEYTGKRSTENADWFQSRLNAFEPMMPTTATPEAVRDARQMERAQNAVRGAMRRRGASSSELPPKLTRRELEEKAARGIANKQEQIGAAQEAQGFLKRLQDIELGLNQELARAKAANEEPNLARVLDQFRGKEKPEDKGDEGEVVPLGAKKKKKPPTPTVPERFGSI
jgi:hypothetical protein